MILTVTLECRARHHLPRAAARSRPPAHRVPEVAERPGGKGLNVARVLAALGHRTVVTGFAGGRTGEVLRAIPALSARTSGRPGVRTVRAVGPPSPTRRRRPSASSTPSPRYPTAPGARSASWTARPEATTRFEEPGPARAGRLGGLPRHVHRTARRRAGGGAVRQPRRRACPSVPTPASSARPAPPGVPVLLDTSGEPLRRGLAARPDLVKPNADELAGSPAPPSRCAPRARPGGGAPTPWPPRWAPTGCWPSPPDGIWQAVPPGRPTRSAPATPTGAGDSAVAGLLSGLAEGLPWPDPGPCPALRRPSREAGVRPLRVHRLLAKVEVRDRGA